MRSGDRRSGVGALSWLLALLAWYVVDYVMDVVNLGLNYWRLGRLGDFLSGVKFSWFVGDHSAWSHVINYRITLVLPVVIVAVLAAARSRFTWRAALGVGLALVAAQVVVLICAGARSTPLLPLTVNCLQRFLGVLPGPLVASVVKGIDLSGAPEEA